MLYLCRYKLNVEYLTNPDFKMWAGELYLKNRSDSNSPRNTQAGAAV
jgi:hypothetical protein